MRPIGKGEAAAELRAHRFIERRKNARVFHVARSSKVVAHKVCDLIVKAADIATCKPFQL